MSEQTKREDIEESGYSASHFDLAVKLASQATKTFANGYELAQVALDAGYQNVAKQVAEVRELEAQLSTLADQYKDKSEQYEQLRQQFDQEHEAYNDLFRQLRARELETINLQAENQRLNGSLARAQKSFSNLTEENQRLRAALEAKEQVCSEVLSIMRVYHEQRKSMRGVDTPGGLEHMGDVWALFSKWEKALSPAAQPVEQEGGE